MGGSDEKLEEVKGGATPSRPDSPPFSSAYGVEGASRSSEKPSLSFACDGKEDEVTHGSMTMRHSPVELSQKAEEPLVTHGSMTIRHSSVSPLSQGEGASLSTAEPRPRAISQPLDSACVGGASRSSEKPSLSFACDGKEDEVTHGSMTMRRSPVEFSPQAEDTLVTHGSMTMRHSPVEFTETEPRPRAISPPLSFDCDGKEESGKVVFSPSDLPENIFGTSRSIKEPPPNCVRGGATPSRPDSPPLNSICGGKEVSGERTVPSKLRHSASLVSGERPAPARDRRLISFAAGKMLAWCGRCLDRADGVTGGWFARLAPAAVSVGLNILFAAIVGSAVVSRGPGERRDFLEVELVESEFSQGSLKPREIEKILESAEAEDDDKSLAEGVSEAVRGLSAELSGVSNVGDGMSELSKGAGGTAINELPDDMGNMPDVSRAAFNNSALVMRGGYGARAGEGARRKAIKKHGGSDKTEEAVRRSLDWLAKAQNPDGSWGGNGDTEAAPTLSGLAVLAFLSHGENLNSEKYAGVLEKGVRRLVEFAEEPGVSRRDRGFANAILTYALAEAVAVTGVPAAFKALGGRVADLVAGMNKFGSFNVGYDNRPAEAEKDASTGKIRSGIVPGEPACNLSFAAWNYQALRAAKSAGRDSGELREAMKKGVEALLKVHQAKGGGFSFGINQGRREGDPEMAPVGTLCLQLLGAGKSKGAIRGFEILSAGQDENQPGKAWASGKGRFPLYTWYYQTQALFNATKGEGPVWKKWNSEMSGALVRHQSADGSWVSPSKMEADGTGMSALRDAGDQKVYSTALCSLILQVYYRYLPSADFVEAASSRRDADDGIELNLDLTPAPVEPSAAENKKLVTEMNPFEVGRPNGKPGSPSEGLVADEFKTLVSEWPTTQAKEKEDFPQTLAPNQRIAWHMNKIVPENFGGSVLVRIAAALDERDLKSTKTFRAEPALELIFNNRKIWRHRIPKSKTLVTALLPSTFFEEGLNILQVRNIGNVSVAFDWLRAESYKIGPPVFLAIEDLDMMPKEARRHFQTGLVSFGGTGEGPAVKETKENVEVKEDEEDAAGPAASSGLDMETASAFPRGKGPWTLRKNLPEIKRAFEDVKAKFPENAKMLDELRDRVARHLGMGLEPMLAVGGGLDPAMLEAVADALKDTVRIWLVEGDGETGVLTAAIRRKIPSAIVGSKAAAGNGVVPAFNLSAHSDKEAVACLWGAESQQRKDADEGGMPSMLWGTWSCEDRSQLGVEFQKNYVRAAPAEINEWFWSGGSGVVLKDVLDGGKYFDRIKGVEKLAFHGLRRVDKLFQGCRKLVFNVTPVSDDCLLDGAYWSGVLNDDGVATLQIASRYQVSREVEVVCPLPWHGKTEVEIESGFAPASLSTPGIHKLESRKETIEIEKAPVIGGEGGLLTSKLLLTDCVTLRLYKAGCKIASPPGDLSPGPAKAQAQKAEPGVAQVTTKRPDPTLFRTALRHPNGVATIEGPAYSGKTIDATRDDVDGVKNIAPWDSKSTLVEIRYPEGGPSGNEGARVYFGDGPSDAREFSFWVYPRVEKSAMRKIIAMRMELGEHLLRADVKTDEWQRIVVPCDKIPPPCWRDLRLIGDPQDQEYRKGRTVSFELNGFALHGSSHKRTGESGLQSSRVLTTKNSITIILVGRPGSYCEYKHYMRNPADAELLDLSSANTKTTRASCRKEAATLEVFANFPKLPPENLDEIKKLLSPEEKSAIEKNSVPLVLILPLQKKQEKTNR